MRATTLCALLLAAAGCGRVGYDPVVVADGDGGDFNDGPPGPVDAGPQPDGSPPDADQDVAGDLSDAPPADVLTPDVLPPDLGPPDLGPDLGPPDQAPDVIPPRPDLPPDLTPDATPPCTQPFSSPAVVNVSGVTGDLYGPRLSPDGLTLMFGQQGRPNATVVDIYTATRSGFGAPFGAAVPFTEANSSSEDNGAVFTADRQELFLFSTRAGGVGGRNLWVLRRSALTGNLEMPRPVYELNSNDADYMPSVTGDGLIIFFASDRAGGADDIWTATRASRTVAFAAPTRVAELSSLPTASTSPFTSADGLTLYFADDRAGGQGSRDLWTATRPSLSSPFGPAANLGPTFNSSAVDDDPSISLDGREFFFVSARVNNVSRIYRSFRCP